MVAAALGLDGVTIAIAFLFALLVGLIIVRPLLVGLAQQLPVVGGALASGADSVINSWIGALTPAAQAALPVFTSIVSWIDSEWQQLSQTIVGFSQLVYAGLWKIEYNVVPSLVSGALQAAMAGATALAGAERAFALGVEQRAQAGLNAALAATGAAFLAAQAYAYGVGLTAQHLAASLFATAEADAAALAAQERAFAVSAVHNAEQYAAGLYAQAVLQITAAEATLGHDVQAVADYERRALGQAIGQLTGEIDIAKAAAIAAAAAAVVPLTLSIRAVENSRCMRACDVLGAAGEGLQLLDLGAIFALVAMARSDPQGTQRFFTDQVAPAVQGLRSTVNL